MRKHNLEFRKIKSLGCMYEISEDGKIIRNVKSKKVSRQRIEVNRNGYKRYRVQFTFKHQHIMRSVARLVAEAFIGPPPEGFPQVDHIDQDSLNNNWRNLRWANYSMQMKNRPQGKLAARGREMCKKFPRTLHPVIFQKDGVQRKFPSKSAANRVMGKELGLTLYGLRNILQKHRSHTHGWDIIYLNAETKRPPSEDEEIVQPVNGGIVSSPSEPLE